LPLHEQVVNRNVNYRLLHDITPKLATALSNKIPGSMIRKTTLLDVILLSNPFTKTSTQRTAASTSF
jgi:hypothetical protein